MHRNLDEKEYLVLQLAIQSQRDQYLEDIKSFGDSEEMQECLSILEGVEEKLNVSNPNSKDVLRRTASETTVGYTLKESQSMYIALYTFRAQCRAMSSNDMLDDMPDEEIKNMFTQDVLRDYIKHCIRNIRWT